MQIKEEMISAMANNTHPSRARYFQFSLITFSILIYVVVAYGFEKSDFVTHLWSDLFWTIAALLTALRCLKTARLEKAHIKQAWLFFSYANFSWFVGMLIWSYLELVSGVAVPFPSLADVFFIGFAVFMLIGLIHYRSSARSVPLTLKQISELGLILTTILISLFLTLSAPIRELDESFLYLAVSLSYPVLYAGVFFFGLTSPFIKPSKDKRHVMFLLLIAIGIHAFSDTIYSYSLLGKNYSVGNYLDVFWLIGFAVFYWAAFEQSFCREDEDETNVVNAFENIVKKIETFLPVTLLVWISLLVLIFGEHLTPDTYSYFSPAVIMLFFFLAVHGWSQQKLQDVLYDNLLESSEKLSRLNTELEQRVKLRTSELETAKKEAERANLAKSTFMSNMSHELRTPMNAVLGFAQLLKYESDTFTEEQQANIDEILQAGNHLLGLINEVLDLQRIEIGKMPFDIQSFPLSPVIDECVRVTNQLAANKNINICFDYEDDIYVFADRLKLKQVFINLLSNGIKYNKKGGELTIKTRLDNDENVAVSFTDNGIGIAEDNLEKVFSPFVRIGGGEVDGVGIGLAVTREILLNMGGRIELSSELNKGSCFTVYLKPKP